MSQVQTFKIYIIICILWPIHGFGITIHVPNDFPTIQEGIDASEDEGLVLVASGIYVERVNINYNKSITLKSEVGANETIIDGNQNGTVVTMGYDQWEQDYEIIIEGFTVKNGSGFWDYNILKYVGGGFCLMGKPEYIIISKCIIVDSIINMNVCY